MPRHIKERMDLDFFFDTALLPGGWHRNVRVSVRNGLIDTVQSASAPAPRDHQAALAVPGLPNLHSLSLIHI